MLAGLSALVAAAIDLYLPAFPAVGETFNISMGEVQGTLTIFLIGLGIGQGIYGPLLDRYGRKAPLFLGLSLFTLGSLMAAFASSFEFLLVARFIQAIGASAGAVGARAVVADTSNKEESARIYSILGQVMMLAPVTAPLIGSFILYFSSWHGIFYVMAALGLVCIYWVARHLPETLPPQNRTRLSWVTIVQNYARQSVQPAFMFYALAVGILFGCIFVYVGHTPFIYMEHFGLTTYQFGFVFAANALVMIAFSQLNMKLLKKYRSTQLIYLGLIGFILGAAILLAIGFWLDAGLWHFILLLAFCIGMTGFITGNMMANAMAYVLQHAGVTSALLGVIQFVLGGFFAYLFSLIPDSIMNLPLAFVVLGGGAMLSCLFGARAAKNFRAFDDNK